MANIDSIKITQDSTTINYLIKDSQGRQSLENMTIAGTPDSEITALRAGFGTTANSIPYASAYAAIDAVIPRWRVCK